MRRTLLAKRKADIRHLFTPGETPCTAGAHMQASGNSKKRPKPIIASTIQMMYMGYTTTTSLSDKSGSSSGLVLESGRDLLLGLVVTSKTVNPGLDQDKTELGVPVFPVNFEVLADGDRLFNEVPEVLRDGWAKSYPQIKGIFPITIK